MSPDRWEKKILGCSDDIGLRRWNMSRLTEQGYVLYNGVRWPQERDNLEIRTALSVIMHICDSNWIQNIGLIPVFKIRKKKAASGKFTGTPLCHNNTSRYHPCAAGPGRREAEGISLSGSSRYSRGDRPPSGGRDRRRRQHPRLPEPWRPESCRKTGSG